jgi:hypothetical protein
MIRQAAVICTERWLVLIHQIPAKPDYLRVKIGRRLSRLGAAPIKNSVYVLPNNAETLEDMQWLLKEITEGGGEATLIAARFLGGLLEDQVEDLFRAARDQDCMPVLSEAQALLEKGEREQISMELPRLRKRYDELAAVDFFGSPRRLELAGVLEALGLLLVKAQPQKGEPLVQGRTWVTRRGIKVDRMASAWLIQSFIDIAAVFKFVDAKDYTPVEGELRFDMFNAEYTHEGDMCTFEVLLRRFDIQAAGLLALAEIVHDIDLKDGKFGRVEAAGVGLQVEGIVAGTEDDRERLKQASVMFGALLQGLGRKEGGVRE